MKEENDKNSSSVKFQQYSEFDDQILNKTKKYEKNEDNKDESISNSKILIENSLNKLTGKYLESTIEEDQESDIKNQDEKCEETRNFSEKNINDHHKQINDDINSQIRNHIEDDEEKGFGSNPSNHLNKRELAEYINPKIEKQNRDTILQSNTLNSNNKTFNTCSENNNILEKKKKEIEEMKEFLKSIDASQIQKPISLNKEKSDYDKIGEASKISLNENKIIERNSVGKDTKYKINSGLKIQIEDCQNPMDIETSKYHSHVPYDYCNNNNEKQKSIQTLSNILKDDRNNAPKPISKSNVLKFEELESPSSLTKLKTLKNSTLINEEDSLEEPPLEEEKKSNEVISKSHILLNNINISQLKRIGNQEINYSKTDIFNDKNNPQIMIKINDSENLKQEKEKSRDMKNKDFVSSGIQVNDNRHNQSLIFGRQFSEDKEIRKMQELPLEKGLSLIYQSKQISEEDKFTDTPSKKYNPYKS